MGIAIPSISHYSFIPYLLCLSFFSHRTIVRRYSFHLAVWYRLNQTLDLHLSRRMAAHCSDLALEKAANTPFPDDDADVDAILRGALSGPLPGAIEDLRARQKVMFNVPDRRNENELRLDATGADESLLDAMETEAAPVIPGAPPPKEPLPGPSGACPQAAVVPGPGRQDEKKAIDPCPPTAPLPGPRPPDAPVAPVSTSGTRSPVRHHGASSGKAPDSRRRARQRAAAKNWQRKHPEMGHGHGPFDARARLDNSNYNNASYRDQRQDRLDSRARGEERFSVNNPRNNNFTDGSPYYPRGNGFGRGGGRGHGRGNGVRPHPRGQAGHAGNRGYGGGHRGGPNRGDYARGHGGGRGQQNVPRGGRGNGGGRGYPAQPPCQQHANERRALASAQSGRAVEQQQTS